MNPAQQCIDMLRTLEGAVERLQRIINATLSVVPELLSWIVDRVVDGWNLLMDKLQEFWDWFTDRLAYVGDPFTLHDRSVTWKVDVGAVSANLRRDIDDHDLLVDDAWKGRGADQYRQSVPDQREAFTSLNADYAQRIGDALVAMRNAILIFWGAVLVAIIAVCVGFATATGAAVTVFGLPLAPPAALGGILIGLGAIGAALIAFSAASSIAHSNLASAMAGVQTWPTFVTR